MARLARVVIPHVPHHITQRGVRSMDVFSCNRDRTLYLDLLREHGQRFGLEILAYCLMSNHIHLVAIPKNEQSLGKGLGEAHKRYTRMFNFRSGARGYLFQGRFPWDPLKHSLTLLIPGNPIRCLCLR